MPDARSGPRPWLATLAVLGLVTLSAGCAASHGATDEPSTPSATAEARPSAARPSSRPPSVASASPADAATPTVDPASPAALDAPPAAVLDIRGSPGHRDGALGTFTWDGLTADAPWIVPPEPVATVQGSVVEVSFDPAAKARSWTIRWAALVPGPDGDVAGDSPAGHDGAGPVDLPVPGRGAWSLRLDASFGDGRDATWYWRIEVS